MDQSNKNASPNRGVYKTKIDLSQVGYPCNKIH